MTIATPTTTVSPTPTPIPVPELPKISTKVEPQPDKAINIKISITNNGSELLKVDKDSEMRDKTDSLFIERYSQYEESYFNIKYSTINANTTSIVSYVSDKFDRFILNENRIFYFNFTYDGVAYTGCTDLSGNFTYTLGHSCK